MSWKNCHAVSGCSAVNVSALGDVMPFLINGNVGAYFLYPHASRWFVPEVVRAVDM